MMDKLSNYIIVDIGANLTNKKFSRDLDAVIQRAREAGVTKIMVRLDLRYYIVKLRTRL